MGRLRRLFDLFEQKTSLLHLLDAAQRAQGVRLYIGDESGLVPWTNAASSPRRTRSTGRSSVRWA